MTIKLAFFKGPAPTWYRRIAHGLICWATNGPYSHVEFIAPDGMGWSSRLMDGGVHPKAIDFTDGLWDVLTVPGDETVVLAWFKAHEGEMYDPLGFLAWLLPWRISDGTHPFCSEAMALALGLPNYWRVSPNSLHRLYTFILSLETAK